jgi:serine phosphatase RsbU (regulator of sigma subunit)
LIRRVDDRLEIVGEKQSGPPLGVDEGAVYVTAVAPLEPGDLVLLSTDGLTEAMDASGRCFGDERLRQVVLSAPRGATNVGEAVLRAVRQHAAGCPQSDDITVLCFERLAPRTI